MEPMVPDTMSQSPAVMIERMTKGGRRLFYQLDVIQQPERARACGSGPKSTSDRRPVDPPPVVELRIFEGPRRDQARDITFTYNANFFLFATLENARVIAHARGQPPQASTTPVLTGMPVSGMAYLDRPQEAGYFLFPDLSVRHEGRYKLAFNLYEETKEDADKDPDNGEPQGASFDWRMELKSADFTVYSAKKFPGLATSTSLSRTMAEQGTRVRIRRDVRMRRRDGKPGDAGEGDVPRRHRSQTPDAVPKDYRGRSTSGSTDRGPLSGGDPSRRPSDAEFRPPPPGFQAQVPPPPPSHMGYNGAPQYGAPPRPHYAPPPSSGHASPAPPQSPSYSQQAHPAYAQPQPPTPAPYMDRRPSLHPSDARLYHPSPQRESFSSDSRRMSTVSNYGDRSSTPLSAHENAKAVDNYRNTNSASLKLPGISALVTQDPMQAPPPPTATAAAHPIPPPPPPPFDPFKDPPLLLPSSGDDQECLDPNNPKYLWGEKHVNSNGKRQHPDNVSTNWLYRANTSAKNGQRPETRPLPKHYTNVDGFLRPLVDDRSINPEKPWLQYRTR
ncbi:hypothetical protein RB595_004761 [Gaeumannomyces hyphopodioides]